MTSSRAVERPGEPWTRRELRYLIDCVGTPHTWDAAIAPDRQPQLDREAGE
jgi:hypothetical protein